MYRDHGAVIFISGHHNTVKNSIIAYIAGFGIMIVGRDHLVTNNEIHEVGYGIVNNHYPKSIVALPKRASEWM